MWIENQKKIKPIVMDLTINAEKIVKVTHDSSS